ncbi:hypothetical protein AKO1_007393 [Acrasis kona]|uniref:Uncharacterized protein n=1 Tax=Acrasis kona TaxID=1008807 RepID=A0AAW2YRZ2_9EUKA
MDKGLQAKFERKIESKRVKYLIKQQIEIARIQKEQIKLQNTKSTEVENDEQIDDEEKEVNMEARITEWATIGWSTLCTVYDSISTIDDHPKVEFVPGVTRLIIDGDNVSKKLRKPLFKVMAINKMRFNDIVSSRRSSISSVTTTTTTSSIGSSASKSPNQVREDKSVKNDLLTTFIEEFADKSHLFECVCYLTGATNKSKTFSNGGHMSVTDTRCADGVDHSSYLSNHSSLSIINHVRSIIASGDKTDDLFHHHVFVTSNKRLIKWLRIVGAKNIIRVKHWLHVANNLLGNESVEDSDSQQDKIKFAILLRQLSKSDTLEDSSDQCQVPINNIMMDNDDDGSDNSDSFYDDYFSEEPGLDSVVTEMKNEIEDSNCVIM